jgi:PTH1 family peptidyl-tRNA hydrolase
LADPLLLVGLGNPGPTYARHRHNVGFVAVDAIVRRHGFGPYRARFEGLAAEGQLDGVRVVAFKPQTYMNDSGRAVAAAARFYKIGSERLIVVHDEVDLVPGKLRVKRGGGSAGHNGLRSIDAHLGPDYWRVRIGVGHPGDKDLVAGYVLHDFAKADAAWLTPLIEAIAEEMPRLAAGDEAGFMTKVALRTRPPAAKKETVSKD